MTGSLPMAFKAEMVLAVQLISRHRAPRAAALVVLGMSVLVPLTGPTGTELLRLTAGATAAIAASRLLAPGAALASARQSPGPPWLPGAGRLAGLVVLLAPMVGLAAAGLPGPHSSGRALAAVMAGSVVYGTGLGALTMAVTPFAGASAGAGLGLVTAFAGYLGAGLLADSSAGLGVPGAAWVLHALSRVGTVRQPAGVLGDLVFLTGWVAACLAAVGWIVHRPGLTGRRTP